MSLNKRTDVIQNNKIASQLFFAEQSKKLFDAEQEWRKTKRKRKEVKKEKDNKYTVFGISFYDLIKN